MGILRNVCQFMVDENDIVLGIAPQFSRFISEVELQRGIYKYYRLKQDNNYKFIVKDFIKEMDNKIKLIYIDNPNNPTGQIIKLSDIEKICIIAKRKDIYVLIDEAYGDYMDKKNSAISLINKYNNLIVIKSASKVYGLPNDRIGYLVSNKNIIEIYNNISVPFPFSEISSKKFIKALNKRNKIKKKIQKIHKYKKYILENLNNNNYLYTNLETPIFTIKTDKDINLYKLLLKNQLIAENCECFEGLNSKFARIRISRKYKKIAKVIIKSLENT